MLAPYYYERDCQNLVGEVVDHKFLSESAYLKSLKQTKTLWETKYPDHPFEVDIDDENFCNQDTNYQSKCKYDLEKAVERQRLFYYQVSLPHYKDDKFLAKAVTRYKKYLFLKKHNMGLFLVPCYDFDLVWHSHQLHPVKYKADTEAILGQMFNHDDSVNDREEGSKLNRSDAETRQLWSKTFGEDFPAGGAMYRGNPPFGVLKMVTEEEIYAVASKLANITITGISVHNMSPESGKFVLKLALMNNRKAGNNNSNSTILKLKGPSTDWQNNKGITSFTFHTGSHSNLQFDLVEKNGFLCFGSNESFGKNIYSLGKVLEEAAREPHTLNSKVSLDKTDLGRSASQAPEVEFTANVDKPQRGPCLLLMQSGAFQTYTMPENIEQMWGPVLLPRLPLGVPNTCSVASHK